MHFGTTRAVLRFSILLWLPLLLLEVTRPFEISTLAMSPATRTTFFYAAAVALCVALVIGGFAAGMATGSDRPTRALCGQAGSASGAVAFLAIQPSVQEFALAHELAPHSGSFAALVAAALTGGLVAWILSLAASTARARRVALAASALMLGVFAAQAIAVFDPEPGISHGSALVGGWLAAAWLLRNTFRATSTGLRHGVAADLGLAVALPCLCMLAADPHGAHSEAMPVGPPKAGTPNLLLIVVDTLRADHTDLVSDRPGSTPRLARAAQARGTRFTQAWSTVPNTVPSIKALFTGQLASHFGGETRIVAPLPGEAFTLAEAMRDAGFDTAGFTANGLVSGEGFEQGFAHYWSLAGHEQFTHSFFLNNLLAAQRIYRGFAWMDRLRIHKERSQTMRAVGRRWLAREGRRPFFLYLHLLDPHWPYHDRGMGAIPDDVRNVKDPFSHIDFLKLPPPSPRHRRYARDPRMREMQGRYDDEIRACDRDLGRLLDDLEELGLATSTLVVITGDHGEEFFEHGAYGHGQDVYVEEVHVPLVFLWPDDPRYREMPKQIDGPVSLVDVFPTLLDLLELPAAPGPLLGQSLAPLLRGKTRAAHGPVFVESRDSRGMRVAVRDGDRATRFAYLHNGHALKTTDVQVFDLSSDPDQQHPLDPAAADVSARIERTRAELRRRGIR